MAATKRKKNQSNKNLRMKTRIEIKIKEMSALWKCSVVTKRSKGSGTRPPTSETSGKLLSLIKPQFLFL